MTFPFRLILLAYGGAGLLGLAGWALTASHLAAAALFWLGGTALLFVLPALLASLRGGRTRPDAHPAAHPAARPDARPDAQPASAALSAWDADLEADRTAARREEGLAEWEADRRAEADSAAPERQGGGRKAG